RFSRDWSSDVCSSDLANDAQAIATQAPSIQTVDITRGEGGSGQTERVFYGSERTQPLAVLGGGAEWHNTVHIPIESGRFFTRSRSEERRVGQGRSARR